MSEVEVATGAYGFQIRAVDPLAHLPDLLNVPVDAPLVRISWAQGRAAEAVRHVDDEMVRLARAGRGSMEVHRAQRFIRIELPDLLTPEAIVHPFMTTPMAILARWRGYAAMHAGAALINGIAFAVCGPQTAGKSTMLAGLAHRGYPLVADDLLVVDGREALSGPHCIDLRPDAAAQLPGSRYLGVLGARPRHRFSGCPAPARVPLGGVFVLSWTDALTATPLRCEPLRAAEKFRLMSEQDYAGILGPPPPEQVFNLLKLPMWRLERPRSWTRKDEVLDFIVRCAAQHDKLDEC